MSSRLPSDPAKGQGRFKAWWTQLSKGPVARVLGIRDFRLLWFGAFFSFSGSWVQSVAQGYLVYELTRDESKLAMVSFAGMAPIMLLGPIAGTLVDTLNRRMLLVVTQALLAFGALFLAYAAYAKFITYEQILVVALLGGFTSCVEIPARQSIVSRVVPVEDLATAVPLNGLTFNLARLIGPAIGGQLLAVVGPQICYFVNGLSFLALILGALAIRSDLSAGPPSSLGIIDLIAEGFRYTFQDRRLRTLLILEGITSSFGLAYMALLPAIAKTQLGLGKAGLGNAYSMIGIGAVAALALVTALATSKKKELQVLFSMTGMALGLFLLAATSLVSVAYCMFALLGLCAIMQFNTTNSLLQTLSPDHLRGRVIAMHVWALSGLGPVGTLGIGWLAARYSIPIALGAGASVLSVFSLWGWTQRAFIREERGVNFADGSQRS
ncbi:MAG: MFS transporter [Fimbriimonas sp.]